MQAVLLMIFETVATQFSLMISEALGLFALRIHASPPVETIFVDDFLVHIGSLRYQMHASPVEAVLLMISAALGAVCAVESIRHQWKQFSLMISEPTMALCALESMRHPWKQFR